MRKARTETKRSEPSSCVPEALYVLFWPLMLLASSADPRMRRRLTRTEPRMDAQTIRTCPFCKATLETHAAVS
jgi:hypothetical protein